MKKFLLIIFVVVVFLLGIGNFLSVRAASTITVTSPNGGEDWAQGSSHNITWDYQEVSEPVDIWLYKDAGHYRDIAKNESCDGFYTWNIPLSFPIGSTYQVVIQGTGAAFFTSDKSDSYFSITGTLPPSGIPHIDSIYPTEGPSGTLITITGKNFNPDPKNNIVGFCEEMYLLPGECYWTWSYPVTAAADQLTVYPPAVEVTFLVFVKSLTAAGWTISDNSATFTNTEQCPYVPTKCECVADVPSESGCTYGHCSSFCDTGFTGNLCSNDVDCTEAGQCNLPNKCGHPCLTFGPGWTATGEGICPIGDTCCAPPGGDGDEDGDGGGGGAGGGGGIFRIENPLEAESFQELLDAITGFIFWLGMAVAPIMILIAGFYFVTSAGDPNRVQTAQKMILYTVFGLVIVLFAKGLVVVLKSILGAT